MKKKRLNIGSSSCHLTGWINLEYDKKYWDNCSFSGETISSKATKNKPDAFGDATKLSIYEDNKFDEIRASHILEHIPQNKTIKTIKEWFRILKPSGIIRIIVPDLSFIVDKWANKNHNEEWWKVQLTDLGLYCDSEKQKPFELIDDAFVHLIFLNGHHLTAFTPELLEHYMKLSGFVNIKRCDSEEQDIPDCTVCDYSLRLQGEKQCQ